IAPRTMGARAYRRKGEVMTTVTKGLWVPLEARAGKEADVARFLEGGRSLAGDEPETTAWFAVRLGDSRFAIFDVFPDDSGRQAHLSGRVAEALMGQAEATLTSAPANHRHEDA